MKIKQLTKEQLIITADRLTRFKEPETRYLRVFKEIILNNLIEPKYKKADLEEMDYSKLKSLAEFIINSSLAGIEQDFSINEKLLNYEKSIFKLSPKTKVLLTNKINYKEIIKIFPYNIPDNLKFLKKLGGVNCSSGVYPIQKILLCEGITEEILLPKFAQVCNQDFEKHGIHVISAGGKNQVVKYFYNYAEYLNIPVFILLDSDATENLVQIKPRLRSMDKIHLVKSGEFEDLLPKELIIKTLNYETRNISLNSETNINEMNSTVDFLEDFFRHRGLHEFKKAEFAQSVYKNISGISDVSDEIREIIEEVTK